MTSIDVKKNVEELTKRIEQVKTGISKVTEQLEQLKSDEAQIFGAIQYANSIYNVLVKEEEKESIEMACKAQTPVQTIAAEDNTSEVKD